MADLDGLFLPEYIKVSESDMESGSHCYYLVSREGSRYYINRSIEITREEYMQCVGAKKDFEEPQTYETSGAFSYAFFIKYPLEKEKLYKTGRYGSVLANRIKIVMHRKLYGPDTLELEKSLTDIFEKYGVKSAYAMHLDETAGLRSVYYGALNAALYDDEGYIKSHENASVTNLYTSGGKTAHQSEDDGFTVVKFDIPGEKKQGVIILETEDLLTRPLLIAEIKLVVLTDGKLPVLRGTRLTVHVLFIGMVQIMSCQAR